MRFNYVLTIGAFTTATMAALAQSPSPQQGYGAKPELPPPSASAIKFVKVVGWPAGKTPTATAGFTSSVVVEPAFKEITLAPIPQVKPV